MMTTFAERTIVWVFGIAALSVSATLLAQESSDRERAAISLGAFTHGRTVRRSNEIKPQPSDPFTTVLIANV